MARKAISPCKNLLKTNKNKIKQQRREQEDNILSSLERKRFFGVNVTSCFGLPTVREYLSHTQTRPEMSVFELGCSSVRAC